MQAIHPRKRVCLENWPQKGGTCVIYPRHCYCILPRRLRSHWWFTVAAIPCTDGSTAWGLQRKKFRGFSAMQWLSALIEQIGTSRSSHGCQMDCAITAIDKPSIFLTPG